MEFSYRDYVSEHGKMPRGYGYWAFATKRFPGQSEILWVVGTFSEAKQKAKEHFKGERLVYVLS